MNDVQRRKRNFRNTKAFKQYKRKKYLECNGIDRITGHKLRHLWSMHHEDMREEHYEILNDNFLCCNNLTHRVIHWLWRYYQKDRNIIERLRQEMERMEQINSPIFDR